MQVSGKVVKVGDDVDTDVIFPARYLAVLDRKQQAKHLFEPLGPEFRAKLDAADVLVAGYNVGCGSSREHAVTALIGHGLKCVIAKSFARIFFRNAINTGLAVVVCPELVDALKDTDAVGLDLRKGEAKAGGKTYRFEPLTPALLEILEAGGLWARRKLKQSA